MHAISRDDSQRNGWRTRRDLNPQHPVPKTGDTPSDTAREQEVTTTTESMPAESPALACESTPDDSDLAHVVSAWPALSAELRAAVLALVSIGTGSASGTQR